MSRRLCIVKPLRKEDRRQEDVRREDFRQETGCQKPGVAHDYDTRQVGIIEQRTCSVSTALDIWKDFFPDSGWIIS